MSRRLRQGVERRACDGGRARRRGGLTFPIVARQRRALPPQRARQRQRRDRGSRPGLRRQGRRARGGGGLALATDGAWEVLPMGGSWERRFRLFC